MAEVVEVQTEERPCPLCGVTCEPEVDGDHRYFECANDDCEAPGYTFGYEKTEEGTRIEGNCAIGVPESVRKAASAGMESAMADERKSELVPIQISLKRPTGSP